MDIHDITEQEKDPMPLEELASILPNEEQLPERVYDTLLELLIPEYRVPWVEVIFAPGKPCYEAYFDMQEAYERLCARLGVRDEDADVEIMIQSLLKYGRVSAIEMFKYGRIYQKMQAFWEGKELK